MSSHAKGFCPGYKKIKRHARMTEEFEIRRMLRDRKFRGRVLKGFVVSYCLFEYQLFRGQEKFPRTILTTGMDIKRKNAELEDKFYSRLKTDDSAVLWRWKPASGNLFTTVLRKLCDRFDGEHLQKYRDLYNWAEKHMDVELAPFVPPKTEKTANG